MTALMLELELDEPTHEAPTMNAIDGVTADHTEADGVDWSAWWAEYSEMME